MTADNWISVSSEDVTELGFWKSVTIRAEENTSGSIRKCRMRLDAFDIATSILFIISPNPEDISGNFSNFTVL